MKKILVAFLFSALSIGALASNTANFVMANSTEMPMIVHYHLIYNKDLTDLSSDTLSLKAHASNLSNPLHISWKSFNGNGSTVVLLIDYVSQNGLVQTFNTRGCGMGASTSNENVTYVLTFSKLPGSTVVSCINSSF